MCERKHRESAAIWNRLDDFRIYPTVRHDDTGSRIGRRNRSYLDWAPHRNHRYFFQRWLKKARIKSRPEWIGALSGKDKALFL